jgi:excisionase family DNA binding protein
MSIASTGLSREDRKARSASSGMKPLAVPVNTASKLLGVGNTKMWELIKDGRVQTISIGRRRLVIYDSLERLVKPLRAG